MNIKKIIEIFSFLLGLNFIICIIIGFCMKNPAAVSKNLVFSYRLLTGIQIFIEYLPIFMITCFVITFAVYFGKNSAGSSSRFSQEMLKHFKTIMILSLIVVFVLTMSLEVFGTLTAKRKNLIVNRPRIINEYIKVGNNLYNGGFYERAKRYGQAALKLDNNSKEAIDLIDRSDEEIQNNEKSNLRLKIYESVEEAEKVDRVVINAKQINEVYNYYLMAKDAFDKKQWFNAHYFAETGISLATPKDPNLEELKKISNNAWNNLNEYHNLEKSDEQKIFDKKYEGYLALVQKDDLKAYYIFRELYTSSRQMQADPDVNFYLEIAENRVNERTFFIDETFELERFENANDIYFVCNYKDGTKDIIYFKGMTSVQKTGNTVQYLRDLTIITVDDDGNFYRKMHVPYAKMLPVSVKNLSSSARNLMGIDANVEFIPYIILKSIERDRENSESFPTYEYFDGTKRNKPEYLLLSMPYDDFLMLETFKTDVNSIPIGNLLKLIKISEQYGYPQEVFTQVFMNRIFYPIWMLILFLLIAAFAWDNRLNSEQYFKFTWVLAFPVFFVIGFVFYKLSVFIFKLMNFTMLGSFGFFKGTICGIVVYFILLIATSLRFLSCKNKV